MGIQTDHDTVIILVQQGMQIAGILEKHEARLDGYEGRINSLEMSRVRFLATAGALSTASAAVVGLLFKHFWPQ